LLAEAARRLIGGPPTPGFVDDLRTQFEEDAFVRDMVIGVVADVAFGGRVPAHRPPGASWDRGLTWWAAALAGITPAEFEARSPAVRSTQRALFETDSAEPRPAPASAPARRPVVRRSPERAALTQALRELIASADGDQVPVSALRQMLDQLERQP
jgi:hypothetical protein